KLWFCSQSCLLQYESSGGRSGRRSRAPARGRVGVVKVVRWTLGIVAGLVVVGIVAAVVDNTSGGKANTRVAAGAERSNPVPLHVVGGVWDGWRLRILSVTPNAVSLLGKKPERIPPGGQELMVSIAATLKAGGHA